MQPGLWGDGWAHTVILTMKTPTYGPFLSGAEMNTAISNKVSQDIDVNTAIKLVRTQQKAAEAALTAPMPAHEVNAYVKREIEDVIGKVSAYEVRYLDCGIIDAYTFIGHDGSVVNVSDRAWDLYGVTVPGLRLKKGYKMYVRTLADMNGRPHMMPSSYFAVLPAMWRRVLCMPNSRAYYGVWGWLQGFKRHSWANGTSHVLCMSTVADLEQYCK